MSGSLRKRYAVRLRTGNQRTDVKHVEAANTGDALRTLLGTTDWREPVVIVLTVGEPSDVPQQLRDIAGLEEAMER